MRTPIVLGLCAAFAVTACGRKAEKGAEAAPAPAAAAAPAGPSGFGHEAGFDAAGYFQPTNRLIIGNYELDHIALGAPSDFAAWEKGEREGLFGPVWIEFENVTSPLETNELGAETHKVRVRVVPEAYRLDRKTLAFRGRDPKLGAVVFEGAFDAPTFAEAFKTGSSGEQQVLIGSLTVGANTIGGQKFTYWAGD